MSAEVINFTQKLGMFNEHWSPKVIAQMNDYQFKLVKLEGEFIWHLHDTTDEVFVVLNGSMTMAFRDKETTLNQGEMCIVPKGLEHRPSAANECEVLLIEPKGISNTGDRGNELTAPDNVWI